ncbi:DUF2877 domain-containing protein [bacterium]|nr:MAG: DUF2877 domain-containing protein [bacterium]
MIFNRSGDSAIITRQAKCIGARAKSLVNAPGFSGRVLAVLSDVAYLSGRNGEILWLFREGVPLHGRGILLTFPLQCLHSGQGFLVEGDSLKIGRDLVIDLGRATEWMPNPLRRWEIGPLVRVNHLGRQLLGTIAPDISDDGPGQVILGLASILNGWNEATFSTGSWQLPILSPVLDLMTQCLEGGLSEIGTRGRELIGLGPGLTPCGDDFLGGLLFAAHWLQEAYPGKRRLETKSIFNLMHWARNRTHPISHAILGDLAIGQGPEPLHKLLRLLLKGEDLDDRTMDAIDCLLKVGHTTGWCILAGLLTCLLSVDERQNDGMAHTSSWVKGEAVWPYEATVL